MNITGRSGWTLLLASLLGLPTAAAAQEASVQYKPGELLIKLRGSSETGLDQEVLNLRPFHIPASAQGLAIEHWRVATFPESTDLAQAKEQLLANPEVERVEYNYRVKADQLPDDPSFPQLWALNNTGQTGGLQDADIDAPEGWMAVEGALSPVAVGVIDTGVDYTHPDLAANIWVNPGEVPNNGIDDDGNGYVDDIHGWDFVNDDSEPMDDQGHGTHIAGTIGAVANNGIGIAGVSPNARIMALKTLGADGYGYTDDAIEALLYATGAGARVANASWGGDGESQALQDALAAADSAGMLLVASAGNDGADNDQMPHYPAAYEAVNVVAVAATDATDTLARFSNFGPASVDLAAPGVGILSTAPGDMYIEQSGTSMAAAHVTGALAVLFGSDPDGYHRAIRDRVNKGVDPLQGLIGKVDTAGRLNLKRALGATGFFLGTDFEVSEGVPLDGNGIPQVSISGPSTAESGPDFSYVTYTAVASDPDGDPLTFTWLRDGEVAGHGDNISMSLSSSGVYRIAVIASDGHDSAMAVKNVTVGGQVPVVTLTGPSSVSHANLAMFKASVDDPDSRYFSYTWRIDGAIVESGGGPNTDYFDTTIEALGTHTVEVAVSDGVSSVTKSLAVEVTNYLPPVGSIYGPARTYPNTEVTYFVGERRDIERDPLTYTWSVDGIEIATGTSFSHRFSTPGTHAVKVTLSDGYDTASSVLDVEVGNRVPHVELQGPDRTERFRTVTYDASGSVDPDNDPLSYSWWVDGVEVATGSSFSHQFSTPGTHTLKVAVSDGYDTASRTLLVDVVNLPPQVELLGPDRAERFEAVTYDASGSVDPEHDPLTYTWEVNGNLVGSGPVLTHSFERPDTFTIEVTVSDGYASVSKSIRTTVPNLRPGADAGADQTVRQISVATLKGSGSDPEGDRLTYSWIQRSGPAVTLSDPSSPTTTFETPNLRGDESAVLRFELIVTDEWGARRSDNTSVTVVRHIMPR